MFSICVKKVEATMMFESQQVIVSVTIPIARTSMEKNSELSQAVLPIPEE